MKRQAKIALLGLTTCVALGGVLWMRELASWRPVKVGTIEQGFSLDFLSHDEQTAVLTTDDLVTRVVVNLPTGRNLDWPETSSPNLIYSSHSPEWAVTTARKGVQGELRVRETQTGRLKGIFHWPVQGQLSNCTVLPGHDGKPVAVVDFPLFLEWNVENKTPLRQVVLKGRVRNDSGFPAKYALSLDGKELLGCVGKRGRAWKLPEGTLFRSWTTPAAGNPLLFSPDARIIVYSYSSTTNVQPPSNFVDTITGIVQWTTTNDYWNSFSDVGDKVFFPQNNNCEVRNSFTGRITRQLPGPRQSDGNVLRVTPDFIYTINSKNEIYRWRAR